MAEHGLVGRPGCVLSASPLRWQFASFLCSIVVDVSYLLPSKFQLPQQALPTLVCRTAASSLLPWIRFVLPQSGPFGLLAS